MSLTLDQNQIPEVGDRLDEFGMVTNVSAEFDIYIMITFDNSHTIPFLRKGWDTTN